MIKPYFNPAAIKTKLVQTNNKYYETKDFYMTSTFESVKHIVNMMKLDYFQNNTVIFLYYYAFYVFFYT